MRLTPPLKPLQRKLAELFRYDYTRKIALDEHGTLFYGLVNGQNTLGTIVGEMAPRLGKGRKEVESMVVLFARKLMTMNMLALKVPVPAPRSPQ